MVAGCAAVPTGPLKEGEVHSLACSPDGRLLASGGDSAVELWDARTGLHFRTLHGHTGRVQAVAFSPDSRWLASGGFTGTYALGRFVLEPSARIYSLWERQCVY